MTRPFPRAAVFAVCLLLQSAVSQTQSPNSHVPSPELRAQLAAFDTDSDDPITVIVELMAQPAATNRRRGSERETQLNRIRTERGTVFSQMRRLGIVVSPKHEFELAYNGFSLTLPARQLPLLAAVPGIAGIHPNLEAIRESVRDTLEINVQPELVNGVPAIQAPAAWAAGVRGQGMRIAIIDDGVDYTHPDLGGCLGAGCKVIGGYDFVRLDSDPQEGFTTVGTVTTRDFHGTHVASIAAGAQGVAPDANIVAVRVLGSDAISSLDTVMAGIEFALRSDVDVINMSIGFQNTTAHSANPFAVMTGNVVTSGVVWVNSNGNDGASGPYRPNMYGASPLGIATGNADARPTGFPRTTVVATSQVLLGGSYGAAFPPSLLDTPQPVVDVGFGNFPSAYVGKDVAGKIVIASRGGSGAPGEDNTFVNKGNQAAAAGAAALIMSNNMAGDFSTAPLAVPSFTVSLANGNAIRANPSIVVETFSPGPQISPGSSRGPTTDLLIKPDVSAPGTSVVAAVPFEVSATGYAALSGTSMASPHVAGAAVLLRQAHPEWTPTDVKVALMNTANNLSTLLGVNFRAIEQGAGFIDVQQALNPSLTATPGSLSFGQLGPSNGYSVLREVAVSAGGTYNVGIEWVRSYTGITATPDVAQVAGQSTVGLAVSILPTAAAGEYEGYLTFSNSADPADTYRVPFLAVHAIPVSQIQFSKAFARSSTINTDSVGVTFSAGQPLAEWYLGSFPSATGVHTRLTLNQPGVPAGTVNYTWDARGFNATGGRINLGGLWSVGVYYRLAGSSTFAFGNAYGRLYMDNTAPVFGLDAGLPTLTNNPQLTIVGAVGDTGMWTFGEVGGGVFVNEARADLFPRAPATTFPLNNNELAFEKTLTLLEGSNAIQIYARDAAGNRSVATFNFTVVLDSIPPAITFTGARTYTVNEHVSVSCAATDSGSGIASTTCGGAPLLDSPAWLLPLGPNTVTATATDVAGNSTTASATATVIVTYDSLLSLTGIIASGGPGRSLLAQLGSAKAAAARGDSSTASNILSAFQNDTRAQEGKSITTAHAAILVNLAHALKQ